MTSKRAIIKEVVEDLSMIILGVCIFLFTNETAKIISIIFLILVAIYSCLEGTSRIIANRDRMKSLKEENQRLRDDVNRARLENTQEVTPQPSKFSIPELKVNSLLDNTEQLKQFIVSISEDGILPNSYRLYFNNILELIRVDEDLFLFKKSILEPFIKELNQADLPLSNDDRNIIFRHLLQYSFIFMDYIDTYRFNINNTEEQLLSLKVAKGEISPDDAKRLATPATQMADETPKYIRVLKEAIEAINSDKDAILYSGYKL